MIGLKANILRFAAKKAAYPLLAASLLSFAGLSHTGTYVLMAGNAAYAANTAAAVRQIGEAECAPYDFTVAFAGDINLAEQYPTTDHMDASPEGIRSCISPELIAEMQNADIMCLNNEFTYSTRGTPMAGKAFTFRAAPERVRVLQELGVDVVKLANNHVYDYGKDAFLDTLDTLDGAGIAHMGAGRNLKEAMEPVYIEADGMTVAFVAATRAEKNIMTPAAGENSPGVLRCYDTQQFKETIRAARAHADFVIAYVHWGTEYSYQLESVQQSSGKEYLDAGADVVLGAHSHCLQGMEYVNGKPILYSLGNYWFNGKTLDTALVKLHFYGRGRSERHLTVQVIPAVQSGCETHIAKDGEKRRILNFLEGISVNAGFTEDGVMYEKQ